MLKACVTGADGFIGKNVVKKLLERGYEVWAVGINENRLSDLIGEKLHFIKAFFEDYDKLTSLLPKDGITYFFHFAWNGVFGESFKNYDLQINNSIYACKALMIAKGLNCKKFIFASTVNALETRGLFGKSDINPRVTNIYSMSKLSAEMICKTLAFQNGIEFNCGMIAMVYGEENRSLMIPNVVINNLLKGVESNLVPYESPYDIIYVEDVANAFIAMAEKGSNLKTYYIGHSEISTFGEIFSRVRDLINPDGVLNFGKYPENNLIDYSLINLNELYEDTGFKPMVNFDESIIKTSQWLKLNF